MATHKYGFDVETNINFNEKGRLRSIQLYNPTTDICTFLFRPSGASDWQSWEVKIQDARDAMKKGGPYFALPFVRKSAKIYTQDDLKRFFSRSDVEVVPHNGYFDTFALAEDMDVFPKVGGDSYVLAALIPSGPQFSRSLDNVTRTRVDKDYDKHAWGSWWDFEWNGRQSWQSLAPVSGGWVGYQCEGGFPAQLPVEDKVSIIYGTRPKEGKSKDAKEAPNILSIWACMLEPGDILENGMVVSKVWFQWGPAEPQTMLKEEQDKFKVSVQAAKSMDPKAILYGCFDAWASYISEATMREEYSRYANEVYQTELDLMQVLTKMRLRGILVDEAQFKSSHAEYAQSVSQKTKELCELRGKPVRPNAAADIAEWLYVEKGIQCPQYTESGKPSTAADVLEMISDPVIDKITDAKEAQSVLSTLNKLVENNMGHLEADVRIFHPEFKPISTSSGSRIYTTDPSVNSWPWPLRACVVPPPGKKFWFGDISAFELMLAAFDSGEKQMVNRYLAGEDIHRTVASGIFKCAAKDVTDDQREASKVVEFANLYGSEGHSVSRKLNRPLEDCKKLMADFLDSVPAVKALRSQVYAKADQAGVAMTPFGRYKRMAQGFGVSKELVRRQAYSFRYQSGAADWIKKALVKLDLTLPPECHLVFTVFDSILIAIPQEMSKQTIDACVLEALTIPSPVRKGETWSVRIKSGMGENWLKAKESMEGVGTAYEILQEELQPVEVPSMEVPPLPPMEFTSPNPTTGSVAPSAADKIQFEDLLTDPSKLVD